jgi:hypothetical protein
MQGTAMYTLAKLRIDELQREAERDRLARRARDVRSSGAIDAVGYRERLGRILGGFPPLGTRGPRPAGA